MTNEFSPRSKTRISKRTLDRDIASIDLTQLWTQALFSRGTYIRVLAYLLNRVPGEIEHLEMGEVDEGRPLQRRQRVVREVQLQQGQRVVVLRSKSQIFNRPSAFFRL